MIEVRDLSKSYGDRPAIESLNFSVQKGEVVGFLGPNGAGKSTTMKIITGFMAPTSGEVKVAGFDVFESPIEVKKKIGYLPEVPPIYPDMRVTDYLNFVAKLKGVASADLAKLVDQALDKCDLGDVRHRLIGNLSKGFKQRVGLAQALVADPELLILDEPTSGLDPKQVSEFRHLLQQLKGGGHTIILSTHILPEVQTTCERIIIINQGQIVAEDSLEGLSARLSGGKRVRLKVRRNAEQLEGQLSGIAGVTLVKRDKTHFEIDTDKNEETLDQILGTVINVKCGLSDWNAELALEDIFIRLTQKQPEVNA